MQGEKRFQCLLLFCSNKNGVGGLKSHLAQKRSIRETGKDRNQDHYPIFALITDNIQVVQRCQSRPEIVKISQTMTPEYDLWCLAW